MITTKTGDSGQTNCGGKRVDKDDLLVETIGEIDELQAVLGLVECQTSDVRCRINKIIQDLAMIMGDLGGGKISAIRCQMSGKQTIKFLIEEMEKEIEKNNINLNKFVIFTTKKAKELNWARTVCRRVERRVVALRKKNKIDKNILKYFNRLSDYLFIKAFKNN